MFYIHKSNFARYAAYVTPPLYKLKTTKISLKVKGQGQMSPKSNGTITHILTKLHQFLISTFSIYYAHRHRDTQINAAKTIMCFAGRADSQNNSIQNVHKTLSSFH